MNNVISVDFARVIDAQPVRGIRTWGREAAAFLGRHTGRVVKVRSTPSVVTARVEGTEYNLSISVGSYSTLRRRPPGEPIHEWIARRDAAPHEIVVDVVADLEWIVNPGAVKAAGSFGDEYVDPEFKTVAEAAAWVRANCRRSPAPRVSLEEIETWMKKTVRVFDPGVGTVAPIALNEAVRIFGPIYGKGISAEILTEGHKVPAADAVLIVNAVRKILPQGRP